MTEKHKRFKFDVQRIVADLGGPSAFAKQHAIIRGDYGFRPLPKNTVASWIRNDSIPGFRLPEVYYVGRTMGKEFNIFDYMVEFDD